MATENFDLTKFSQEYAKRVCVNRLALADAIHVVVCPHSIWSLPKTPENVIAAKDALLNVLAILEEGPLPSIKDPAYTYLEKLETIYFYLADGDYIMACHEIEEFVYYYCTKEAYDGLVLLLQKVAQEEFPDGYTGK